MRKRIRLAQNKDDLYDLGSDDLLSRFSDDILVSILSYLPVKDAAVTSILSRRWRYLWCQIDRLDFEDMERSNKIGWRLFIEIAAEVKKYIDVVCAERNKYINWVDCIIHLHKSPTINEFKICFDLNIDAEGAIDKWIEFAISKKVQRLELDLDDGLYFHKGKYAFPIKIFDRKCGSSSKQPSFDVPVRPYTTVVEMKFLKALVLKCVDVNDEDLKKILSNCPVLEHLSIYGTYKLEKVKIDGKGLALKHLEIIYCDELESIEICDSNIVSFNCRINGIRLRLNNLQKLEKIAIHDNHMRINDMFCWISCCIPYLQVLELLVYHQRLFRFPNLPKLKQLILEFGARDNGSLYVLTSFLEACPNLQRFTIKLLGAWDPLINRKEWQVAKQPHEHPEVVEIYGYYGWTFDLELAMYFIRNVVALKRLVIQPFTIREGLGNEIVDEHAARCNAQQQLEPITPAGVELIIL